MQQVRNTLPTGSIVGDRYQVEALLGKGGFGAVYLVRDLRVQQNTYALKEIVDAEPRERRHLTSEAELLKRVDHPSLPRLYRVFDDPAQGRAYLLIDYIEGSNLERVRRQRVGQRLPVKEMFALLAPVVEAIIYLHAQMPPIVHRDIKPSNIVVPASGTRAVLVDFGIAKEFDREGTTSIIRHASPGYGAPEQYSSGTDMRTDVYGLGATLYTLLTGTVPADAFFRLTHLATRGSDPLVPVNHTAFDIPVWMAEAITRAMALEQEKRFASVEDFWRALQPEMFRMPVSAPAHDLESASSSQEYTPAPVAARPVRPVSSLRTWALVLLGLSLALCLGLASALLLSSPLHNQQPAASARTSGPTVSPTPPLTPSPTTTPLPTSTPTPVALSLAANYSGTIHEKRGGNFITTMSLTGVSQQQQKIQGNFRVQPPLIGSGPFVGIVHANHSSIQFTVRSSDHLSDGTVIAPLLFSGQVQQDGGISGQYCSLDATGHCNPNVGGYGTWSVRPGAKSS